MNKQTGDRILKRLRELGVTTLIAEYSGGGDSGQFDGFLIRNADGQEIRIDLDVPDGQTDALKAVTARLTDRPDVTFSAELEQLMWDTVDACGHNGWENNDGGAGQLIIDVEIGTVTLDHNDYYTETTNTSHTVFGGDEPEEEST